MFHSILSVSRPTTTSHPKQWPLAWPCYPVSETFPSNSTARLNSTLHSLHFSQLFLFETIVLGPRVPKLFFLPSPTYDYSGISAYLEDFVSRISAPLLDSLRIKYYEYHIFRSSQLNQFIARSERLRPFKRAYMTLHHWSVRITFDSPIHLDLGNVYEPFPLRVSAMSRLCDQTSPLLSHVNFLEISGNPSQVEASQSDNLSANWLEIFHQFTSVESLFVSAQLMPFITPALKELTGESAPDVLPALRSLSFEPLERSQSSLLQDAIRSFVTGRQLSGCPVTVERRGREPC